MVPLARFWFTINECTPPLLSMGVQPDQDIDVTRANSEFLYFHLLIIEESYTCTLAFPNMGDAVPET